MMTVDMVWPRSRTANVMGRASELASLATGLVNHKRSAVFMRKAMNSPMALTMPSAMKPNKRHSLWKVETVGMIGLN